MTADPFAPGRPHFYPVYTHTQPGWVIIAGIFLGVMAMMALNAYDFTILSLWPTLAILMAILALFATLTVTLDDSQALVVFGVGLKMPAIELANVAKAEIVKNSLTAGWGIRLLPGGIMYNVSGLQAVQLAMKDGYIYRIGTDDPQGLLRAIEMRLAGMPQ